MLMILSPAKTMRETGTKTFESGTVPEYLEKTSILAEELKKLSADAISRIMKINPALAQLNYGRFQQWKPSLHRDKGTPALLSYQGEVFRGLEAASFSENDFRFAQKHVRILSGFYGILRPLDKVLPYRLEMGGRYAPAGYRNLYAFWKEAITDAVDQALNAQDDRILVNLASHEYFKCLDKKRLNAKVITPVFKEARGNDFKMVTVYAKKARGMMARFILKQRLKHPEQLKFFEEEGYFYNESLSDGHEMVFTR
jgi:cytoplasmic iron level regulating protein YaaA (DUF328/UPF0246 family)